MKNLKRSAFALSILIALLSGCSKKHVDIIKEHADETWKNNGFTIIGYQGYQYGAFGNYGGCVWYTVARGNTTYDGCISKWDNEYHIYKLKALDAVKGN